MLDARRGIEPEQLRAPLLEPDERVRRPGVALLHLAHQPLDGEVQALEHQADVSLSVLGGVLSYLLQHRLNVSVDLAKADPNRLCDGPHRVALDPELHDPLAALRYLDLAPVLPRGLFRAFRTFGVPFGRFTHRCRTRPGSGLLRTHRPAPFADQYRRTRVSRRPGTRAVRLTRGR